LPASENQLLISDKALALLQNKEVLLTKRAALEQITMLLQETKETIAKSISEYENVLPNESLEALGVVSKGENYQELPYQVLDYPAVFSLEDIFAYRTMFWWGNFFSATLHVQGKYLDKYRHRIAHNIDQLISEEVYICINDTPWQYHYGPDNYERLTTDHVGLFESRPFIKLSKALPLAQYAELPDFSASLLQRLISIIS
jgi:hypothetical protein